MAHEEIVADFRIQHLPDADAELLYYHTQPTLAEAVHKAALCILNGKRHPHQRRIPGAVLEVFERQLQESLDRIATADSFPALFDIVFSQAGSGIGELTVYDVAHRIGTYLGLEPDKVYLHAGTAEGAEALGVRGKTSPLNAFPPAFRTLTPAQAEDRLCNYKAELRGDLSPRGPGCAPRFRPRRKTQGGC